MSVLAILETSASGLHRVSIEAAAAAQDLAERRGEDLQLAIIGNAPITIQASKLHRVSHALLADYTADGHTAAYEQLVRAVAPSLVLLPHTYQVRDFAPKLAARFGAALVSDIVGYTDAPERLLFQGRLKASVRVSGSGPQFVSVQAGAWSADAARAGTAEEVTFTPQLDSSIIRQVPEPPFREAARTVDLTAAAKIVSVGRGIGDSDQISVVEELAQALGAELAASRPICDAGWLPMERQVGSSGQTVSPKLYVAVGISGAIQHLVGMKGSKTIVAINKDASAPIFEVAHYGIVGDLFEVVPALVEELNKSA